MRDFCRALVLAAGVGACPLAVSGEPWRLANETIAVQISRASGAIVSVTRAGTSSESGGEFRNPADAAELVRVRFPIGTWDGHGANGSQSSGWRTRSRNADSLTLVASRLKTGEGEFPIELESRYRLAGDNVVVQLRVTNRSSHTIDQITFPMLDLPPAPDGSESIATTAGPTKLRELFSANTVRTHLDPFERLDPEDRRGWYHSDPAISAKAFPYPSGFWMHSAWLAYRAGGLNVGWDVRDASFQSQFAGIERVLVRDTRDSAANRRTYRGSWRWFPLVRPGESWQTPEIYLKFASGDWHAVAKQHRDWLRTWVPRPVVADRLRTSLGWLSRGISSFEQIPAIARSAVEIGAPYFILYGWYGGGMNGLSYDFFPQAILGGETALRENLGKARKLGAYPLAWYNGTDTVETAREHHEQAHGWVVRTRDGGITVDGRWSLFDPDRPPSTDDTTILMNNDLGSAAGAFNVANVRRMIEDYGFSGFEMDQGAKNFLSYSARDPSRKPELHYTTGARQFYEAARRIVKQRDPNGIIVGEGFSDLMNSYVDSTWIFEGGTLNVPLYTYFKYSLPWVTFPVGVFTPDTAQASQAFMMNSPLDIFIDAAAFPAYAAHLRKMRALKERVHTYLYDGDFSDQDGFTLRTAPDSGVLARSYVQPGGGIAIVVANASEHESRATLEIDSSAAALTGRHYRLDGSIDDLSGKRAIDLRLQPSDVQVIVAEGARQ